MLLTVRILLLTACACPVRAEEKRDANSSPLLKPQVIKIKAPSPKRRQTFAQEKISPLRINSKERKDLIGHLQGFEAKEIVLTERQKLAFKQELTLQDQGYEPFSPASDPEEVTRKILTPEFSKRPLQFSTKEQARSQEQFQTNFGSNGANGRLNPTDPQRQFGSSKSFTDPSQTSDNHPEILLNQLSPEQKQLFEDQFNNLSQDLQKFAYNKFISSSPDIQVHAINQFLSLRPDLLAASINRELAKEANLLTAQNKEQPSQNLQQPLFLDQSQAIPTNSEQQRRVLDNRFDKKPFPQAVPSRQLLPNNPHARQPAQPLVERELHITSDKKQEPSQNLPQPLFLEQSQPFSSNPEQQRRVLDNSFDRKTFPQSVPPRQQLLPNNPPGRQPVQPLVERELQLFQAEASKADQLALKQQVEALKEIIAQQQRMNFSS